MADLRILTVVGARPQFVKAAPISRTIAARDGIQEILVHTGQHFDAGMSQIFFDELELEPPRLDLGIHGGGHGEMTGKMLVGLERIMIEERPDLVLVPGDTNSSLAGALAAAKLEIPIAHVEAGLRSFNRRMPEEINRVVADHIADLLLAPTQTAMDHLEIEGLSARAVLTGDVMYDAVRFNGEVAVRDSTILKRLGLAPRQYALVTLHRAENTDDKT